MTFAPLQSIAAIAFGVGVGGVITSVEHHHQPEMLQ
jgi:hypothetical protein